MLVTNYTDNSRLLCWTQLFLPAKDSSETLPFCFALANSLSIELKVAFEVLCTFFAVMNYFTCCYY